MQITSVTDTNYIANPGFVIDTLGWAVAGGNIVRSTADSYAGTSCGAFTPNGVFGLTAYSLTAMSTGLPYVGQARVKAGVGQQIFIQFSGGAAATQYIATGGWDLLTTGVYTPSIANFELQIGIGFELQLSVIDTISAADSLTTPTQDSGKNHAYLTDSISTSEYQQLAINGIPFWASDANVTVQDLSVTSESFSLKRASDTPYVSGNLFLLSVSDTINNYEYLVARPSNSTDKTILVDAVMVEQTTTAGTYFDGDSGNGYHWSGTPNESTSFYRQYEVANANTSQVPNYGVLISWTRALNSFYQFFTIGTSTIGGPDFIAGTSTFPTYFNQYQYGEYSTYLTGISITKNIGQFPYGAFVSQLDMTLDNSTFLFLPGYDPVIGNYIINGRPVSFQIGFNGELLNLFSGISTKPQNDVQHRELAVTALDGMDYLNSFISQGAGPIAAANNGNYVNLPAQVIVADLLAEAGFSTSQYLFEQSLQSNIGYLCPINYQSNSGSGNSGSIGSIISDICEAEQALFFFDESGVPQFWNREHIPTNTTIAWSFAYKSITNYKTEDTPIINDVAVTAQPRKVQALQNIWQLTEATIIPPATTTTQIFNLAINPNFVAVSGSYFNSPIKISSIETVTSSEFFMIHGRESFLSWYLYDNIKLTENVTIAIDYGLGKTKLFEAIKITENIAIKVGGVQLFTTTYNISVSDQTIPTEQKFVRGRRLSENLIFAEYITITETYTVAVQNSLGQLAYLTENVSVYETFNLSTITITGWAVQNANIYQTLALGPPGLGNNSGSITTKGGTSSYVYQQYTVSSSTQYINQMYVLGLAGVTITVQIVQNSVVVQTISTLLDGSWDLIKVPAWYTDPASPTMQIRISSDVPTTFNMGGVMTQLGVGAVANYFDGSTTSSPNYIYSWTGSPYVSTSVGTPCGYAIIAAGFEDDNGSLPVTLVDLPVYNNPNLDSSYLTNLNDDSSGIPGNTYIQLQSATLNGSNYTMTFINTYTQPIYVTQLTLFGTPAKVVYSISQEYKNPTSIALYGTNPANNGLPMTINNNLIQDPSTALSNAYSLVNDYSLPYQRMIAEVFPAYHLQIGDAVAATIDDTQQTLNYNIVGITNGVSSEGEPLQTLEIEVKKLVHYFTINTSIIGGTDSIAP